MLTADRDERAFDHESPLSPWAHPHEVDLAVGVGRLVLLGNPAPTRQDPDTRQTTTRSSQLAAPRCAMIER
ncbi:hypothetical protein GTR00_02465 [Kineococcus sp. T90]|nr:hypothetical protein [Kineococcus indalonis]